MPTQTAQATKNGATVIGELISRFNGQIDSLSAYTDRLESVGHKLKDTNTPEKKPTGDQTPSTGFLSDFNAALERMAFHSDRLLSLANKLEEII